jgi:predicted NBD/HSP70 family sugar kinase
MRRSIVGVCFALACGVSLAQEFPNRPVRIVVPWPPSGNVDITARTVAPAFGEARHRGPCGLEEPQLDEHPGPTCYCGRSGCIEQWVAGPALNRDVAAHGGEIARELHEDRLARAFSMVVNFLNPDLIVLRGGLSNIERLYTTVPRLLPKYVYSQSFDTPIVPAKHGDGSGVRGAAMLWPRSF